MKVIADLRVIPIGVGTSVSNQVATCERILSAAGLKTRLNAYGTNPRQRRGRAGALPVALACAAAAVAVVAMSPLRVTAAPQSSPSATAATPEFEAVSVKPFPEGAVIVMSGCLGGPGSDDPGRINCEYTTLRMLLAMAYEVKSSEIFGPTLLDSAHFNIVAKLPKGATRVQVPAMFRNLLAERFKLAAHHENRAMPAYSLTVAERGLKIKESAPAPAPTDDAHPAAGPPPIGEDGFPILRPSVIASGPIVLYRQGRARLQAGNTTLDKLADSLSRELDRRVTDETGLVGRYDITLNWTPEPAAPGGAAQEASTPDSNLFAALEQQLGLKLVSKKVARYVLVVDHAEKVPAEN